MKRASYREAISWIALNDGPGDFDALEPAYVAEQMTAKIVADLFGVDDARVGKDVVRARKREAREERRRS